MQHIRVATNEIKTLAEMDEAFCIVRFGGKARVFAWERSAVFEDGLTPAFYLPNDLALWFANRNIMVTDNDGEVRSVPLFKRWYTRAASPRAVGITMDSKGGRFVNGALNLWSGFAVEPVKGEWPKLRWHMEHILCNGNTEAFEYLLKWCAWVLQHPTERPQVAVVFRGKQGTGKGLLCDSVLCRIFGSHSLHISNRRHIVGHFNAHLMNCALLFLDEAVWAGDKESEGVLKRTVTERTLTIEAKYMGAEEMRNCLAILIASNELWVIPAAEDDRRYFVSDVSDAKQKDLEYFKDVFAALDAGERAAFMHDMLAVQLGEWQPREGIPQTGGLATQKMESVGPEVHWLWRILDEGVVPRKTRDESGQVAIINDDPNDYLAALSGLLHQHFKLSDGRLRYWHINRFVAFMRSFGCTSKHNGRARYIRFAHLATMRARFHERFPWTEPFSEDVTKWIPPSTTVNEDETQD